MEFGSDAFNALKSQQPSLDLYDSNLVTLKRTPKLELNKAELLNLLSYLEGELQARDIVIAALQAEKANQFLRYSRYGKYGVSNPLLAMERDQASRARKTKEHAAPPEDLGALERLMAAQRDERSQMQEQLLAVEKNYQQLLADFEDERKRHAVDNAEGDDVTYLLEKERERLKQELSHERVANKLLQKELTRVTEALQEESAAAQKHKYLACLLIKERKKFLQSVSDLYASKAEAEGVSPPAEEGASGAAGVASLVEGLERTALKVQQAYRSVPSRCQGDGDKAAAAAAAPHSRQFTTRAGTQINIKHGGGGSKAPPHVCSHPRDGVS